MDGMECEWEVLEILEEVVRKILDVGGAEQSDVHFSERRIHLKVKKRVVIFFCSVFWFDFLIY